MIEINLLPKELKPSNTTPKPRFATIIVGVIILAGLGAWYINIVSIQMPQIQRKSTAATQEISLRQPELNKYNDLVKQKKQFTLRKTTVKNLIDSRVSMETILDKLCDQLSPTDIWFTSLSAKKPTAARRRRAPVARKKAKGTPLLQIEMNCRIQAPDDVRIKRVAEFFESFKRNKYFNDNYILPIFTGLTLKDDEGTFKVSTILISKTKKLRRPIAPIVPPIPQGAK